MVLWKLLDQTPLSFANTVLTLQQKWFFEVKRRVTYILTGLTAYRISPKCEAQGSVKVYDGVWCLYSNKSRSIYKRLLAKFTIKLRFCRYEQLLVYLSNQKLLSQRVQPDVQYPYVCRSLRWVSRYKQAYNTEYRPFRELYIFGREADREPRLPHGSCSKQKKTQRQERDTA